MNKRYQVFVSSTFMDLAEERMEVMKALLELDCIPCGMEYFPAASEETWSYISDLIRQCDYYIVIVAGRYGSLTPEGISFTQKEYECAIEHGVPTIAFLCADPEALPVKKVDTAPDQKKKLDAFISMLKTHLCKEWRNADELGAVVSRSLTQLIKRRPRTGWVPASSARSVEDANEILELNKRIKELEARLKTYESVDFGDTSSLCDNDDLVEVSYTYDISRRTGRLLLHEVIETRRDAEKLSWNKIFTIISPRITPVGNESSVKAALGKILEQELSDKMKKGLKHGEFCDGFKISALSFDVIKLQLQALGLVTVNKEIPDGRATAIKRWRLTDKGRNRMYQLLALKKHSYKGRLTKRASST